MTKLHQVESACGVNTVVEGPLVHHSPTMTSQYKLTVSDSNSVHTVPDMLLCCMVRSNLEVVQYKPGSSRGSFIYIRTLFYACVVF